MDMLHVLFDRAGEWWRLRLGWLKKVLLLPRSFLLRYTEFEIPGAGTGAPLRAAYLGEGQSLPYYLGLYGASPASAPTRLVPLWKLRSAVAQASARFPLVLVEINQLLAYLPPKGGWTTDPWIRQETDLFGERYRRRRPGIERGYGHPVRRHNFRHLLSRDAGDLRRFYDEFYLPYVRQRHGATSSVRSLAALRVGLRSGFLLQVWQGDQWVSGLLACRATGARILVLAVGLHPSAAQTRQQGSVAAAYYFLFRWAHENGLRWVDFCGSRPHLSDGVFYHKSLWAAEPKRDAWHHAEIKLYAAPAAYTHGALRGQLVFASGVPAPMGDLLPPEGVA
jgi:hypothetical protein